MRFTYLTIFVALFITSCGIGQDSSIKRKLPPLVDKQRTEPITDIGKSQTGNVLETISTTDSQTTFYRNQLIGSWRNVWYMRDLKKTNSISKTEALHADKYHGLIYDGGDYVKCYALDMQESNYIAIGEVCFDIEKRDSEKTCTLGLGKFGIDHFILWPFDSSFNMAPFQKTNIPTNKYPHDIVVQMNKEWFSGSYSFMNVDTSFSFELDSFGLATDSGKSEYYIFSYENQDVFAINYNNDSFPNSSWVVDSFSQNRFFLEQVEELIDEDDILIRLGKPAVLQKTSK